MADTFLSIPIEVTTVPAGAVIVTNFPLIQAVSQSGTWTTGRTWTLSSGTDSISIGNFPSTFGVTQSTSPWIISGAVSAAQSGVWNINNVSGTVSLPTGASTLSAQTTGNSSLASIDGHIDVNLSTRASESTLLTLSGKISNDYGVSSGAVRTASQIGNSSGAAAFNSGTTTAQTLRVVLPTDQTSIPVAQSTSPWTVSGTVTANAGVNLNTSLLALDSTLTNATQKTKLVDAGGVNVASISAAGAVKVDGSAVIQPVSGTVTANAGTGTFTISGTVTANAGTNLNTSALALDATLTGGTQTSRITDGTNTATVKTASTAAIATDKAVVVAISPNNTVSVTQSGIWTTGRTWNLLNTTDSVNCVQSGTWNTNIHDSSGSSITLGQKTAGTSLPVVEAAEVSYMAAIFGLVAANTPTDICTITGSASKTVKIYRIRVRATQNTSATRNILLIRRSSANSGGTSATITGISNDSADASATAIVKTYTANPAALGTTVGTIGAKRTQILATNVTNPLDPIEWCFGEDLLKPLVLRGTSELIALNLDSVTSSNNLFSIEIEWTEE